MAYTAPTYDASSQTWAQLKSRGFQGFCQALAAAQTTTAPNQTAKNHMNALVASNITPARIFQRSRSIVDNYTNGKSDKTSAKAQIYDLQQAIGMIATALGEIGTLIDAN